MIVRTLVVGPFMENAYLVALGAGQPGMVIDPGAEPERVLDEAERLGVRVSLVVNTHGHGDHTGAVRRVKEATGAPYAAPRADLALVRDPGSFVRAAMPDFQDPPDPDRLLEDGEEVATGDLSFTVIATPGHTPGGICLYRQDILFTGDTLFQGGIGRFDLPGGDGRQLLDSIHSRLLVLPGSTTVYPGHGPASTVGVEKRTNPFLRMAV